MRQHVLLIFMLLCGSQVIMAGLTDTYYMRRGLDAWQQDRNEEAIKYFYQEIQNNPKNGYAAYYLALACNDVDYTQYVFEYASKAMTLLPKSERRMRAICMLLLRDIYEDAGDTAKVKTFNESVKQISPSMAINFIKQDYTMNDLSKLLSLVDDDPYNCVLNGIVSIADSTNYMVVIDSIEARAKQDSQNHYWMLLADQIMENREQYRESWEYAKRAQVIHPTAFTYTNMANTAYDHFCQINLAEQCLKRAIELDSTYTSSYIYLAQLYLTTGRQTEAIAAADKAIELSNNHPFVYYVRGCIYRDSHEYAKAADEYLKCMLTDPSQTDMLTRSAQMYLYMGDTVRYREYMDRYVHIQETKGKKLEIEDYILLGDTAKAMEMCDTTHFEGSQLKHKEYNLACAYARMNVIQPALQHLRTAVTLGFIDYYHMLWDEDLRSLRETPEFRELIELCKEKIATYNDITL